VSAVDAMTEDNIPLDFATQLREWLADVLRSRFKRPAKEAKASRKLFVCSYWSSLFDQINYKAAFLHRSVVSLLPPEQREVVPMVSFAFKPALGRKWCNHATLAKHLSAQDAQHILSSPCICQRQPTRVAAFIPAGLEHVVTCDPEVLHGCCDDMKELFKLGAKHRPEGDTVVMSAAVRQQACEELAAALGCYAATLPVTDAERSAWCEAVLGQLREQLTTGKFADGKSFTCRSKPHDPDAQFVQHLDSYDDLMRGVHSSFVVTTADKLASNYAVICKRFYVESVLHDLETGGFYTGLPDTATTPAIQQVPDLLLPVVKSVVPDMFPTCDTDEAYKKALTDVPYAAALVKLHKQPYAFRFLACSGKNGLKPPALWLTALLRGIRPELHNTWCETLRSVKAPWWKEPPWFATRSVQVVDMVRGVNGCCFSKEKFEEGGGFQGYDVVRLYTNIDIQDLKSKISSVLGLAWQAHPGQEVVVVYQSKEHKPTWFASQAAVHAKYPRQGASRMLNDRLGVHAQKGKFYVFSLQHAIDVVALLVENSYVRFGDRDGRGFLCFWLTTIFFGMSCHSFNSLLMQCKNTCSKGCGR
jgi:hypothetical protein